MLDDLEVWLQLIWKNDDVLLKIGIERGILGEGMNKVQMEYRENMINKFLDILNCRG